MRVVTTTADGVEKLADLLGGQLGQFPLLQLEQLHPGQWVVVVDLAQVLQLVEYGADVALFVVEALPGYPLFQPFTPQARIQRSILDSRYQVAQPYSQLQQFGQRNRRISPDSGRAFFRFFLKNWVIMFHGVVTKYLTHYLGWRRMLERHKMQLTPLIFLQEALGMAGVQQLTRA